MKSISNTNQINSVFVSSDLSLIAAILASKKARLVDSKRISPYKFEFHLEPLDVCQQLERDYINGQLAPPAKDVADNVRFLKKIIQRS